MPEKCQIIKTNVFASCETYNCLKRIAWAIGRPDGPAQLRNYYCDDCMRDIIASAPEELMPELESPPEVGLCSNGFVGLNYDRAKQLLEFLPDNEFKQIFATAVADLEAETFRQAQATSIPIDFKSVEEIQDMFGVETPKTYPCKYCGEEFDTPAKVGSHTRYCEARKEAKANGET